ncbi:sorbosone dehydrogenase family protein [Rufibacter glacialis]|uniref:Sorbosone dehydrogenase family protein n=1 Tax=Rufibacter glacialis TaxID=1259555 RepID=A0A5M8QH45_9BACT|nr:sorbosone dehydrogenase family protein [Rufibacter glacialis]KAA6434471.1 sorbosone dehydrogenase family protein [Rufibacter glacialis]GGK69943.1 sorbosone dehydrogenase [Rufibacter glacialis]
MKLYQIPGACLLVGSMLAACNTSSNKEKAAGTPALNQINLPAPYATESVTNYSEVIGWRDGKMPQAPAAFTVTEFARNLANPRWIYVAPNGDIFVAEATTEKRGKERIEAKRSGLAKSQNIGRSANRITLLRDANEDGVPEVQTIFLSGLNRPFGMLVLNNYFYVANTDGLWRYPYQPGQTRIKGRGTKIMDLPAGGYNNHWTRNLISNADGSKIYVAVGSGSNNGENGMEHEVRRANILEINPDGTGERVYASGLRNPVGMGWAPGTTTLWTAVNERDELGDDLVPDFLTSVKDGGFYGWPYAYFGPNEDPRMKGQRPDLVKKTLVPDVPLGAHTASLGLAFYDRAAFPAKYRGGAFIGQHGSWNRSVLSGYKVVFVPFHNGKPAGPPEDFLTGFVSEADHKKVHGRPVGVAVLKDGALLVADDASGSLWRVAAK